MELDRKIYNQLINWKNQSNGKTALLIEGARRIGKSTVVENFAKNNYKSYILIDFYKASKRVKEVFDHLDDLNYFFSSLSVIYKKDLYERNSCIIFDEVQKYPKAREAIKALVQDGRYDYIETGSLISIKENVKCITIPSEEKTIQMHPLDFEEFCWALGEKRLIEHIKICFDKKTPLDREMHTAAMLLFNQYMLVGGMPLPIIKFIEDKKQFKNCDEEKEKILNLYRNDIAKIDSKYKAKALSLFDQIPSFLSTHEKRVKFSSLKGSRPDVYTEAYIWLQDSKICNQCFLCNDPNVGLSINENRSFMKCYMADTGLLVSHAFKENKQIRYAIYSDIINNKLSINKGMLLENAIAQTLVANDQKLFFYTKYDKKTKRNLMEIDFIVTKFVNKKIKIVPIEVKSGKNYTTKSLNKFISKYKNRVGEAYIIHPKNLTINKDKIICIPPYMAFLLNKME